MLNFLDAQSVLWNKPTKFSHISACPSDN